MEEAYLKSAQVVKNYLLSQIKVYQGIFWYLMQKKQQACICAEYISKYKIN